MKYDQKFVDLRTEVPQDAPGTIECHVRVGDDPFPVSVGKDFVKGAVQHLRNRYALQHLHLLVTVAEDEVKVYSTSGAVVVNGYTGIVQVYNVTGSLVKNVQVDGYSTIDLRDGIYFVRTGKKAHKVIVR